VECLTQAETLYRTPTFDLSTIVLASSAFTRERSLKLLPSFDLSQERTDVWEAGLLGFGLNGLEACEGRRCLLGNEKSWRCVRFSWSLECPLQAPTVAE